MKNNSCVTFNLAVKEQYDALLAFMGGEDRVKQYKAVYDSIESIKEQNKVGKLLDDKTILEVKEPVQKLVDAVYFPGIYYDEVTKILTVYYAVSYVEVPKAMFLTIKVYDKSGMIIKVKDIDPIDVASFVSGKVVFDNLEIVDSYSVKFTSMVTLQSKDISITQLKEEGYESISVKPIFAERAKVVAPKKNKDLPEQDLTGDSKYIRAFYNRYPFRTTEKDVDYVYEGTYDGDKQVVSVTLEGGGSIALNKDVKVGSYEESSDIAIMDFGCGAVKYTSEGASLGINNKKFTWLFKPDWNATIAAKHYFAETRVNLTYKLGFFQENNYYEDILYLSSILENDMGYSCRKIRKLHIAIGCVEKGTKISIADGRKIAIENIRIGDRIITEKFSKIGTVTNVWKGTERKLYSIHTMDGNSLMATGDHYIYTDKGVIKVEKLNMGTKIQMADGGFQQLKYLYTVDDNFEVYNLSIEVHGEESGSMVCEEMVLKDNDYYEESKPVRKLKAIENEFLTELKELMSKR